MAERKATKSESGQGRETYDRLIAEIRSGALKPGARLTETDLADRLGISRTPVREAIRLLENDGLVDHQPRAGARIRRLDYAEVTELYEMRAVLESTAARFAARAAYDSELDELAAINDDMRAAAGNAERLYHANRQFHSILLNAARNRYLVRSVEAVQKTLLILGPSTMEESGRASDAVAEHDAILAALRAHDGDSAEQAMRRHIEAAHKARLKQLRDIATKGEDLL